MKRMIALMVMAALTVVFTAATRASVNGPAAALPGMQPAVENLTEDADGDSADEDAPIPVEDEDEGEAGNE